MAARIEESYDTVLRHLQEYIVGDHQEATYVEERIFYSNPAPNSTFRLVLDKGLQAGVLDKDTALRMLVINIKGKISIYPIAIALRNGADPNLYIEDRNISIHGIHILAYVHYAWGKNVPMEDKRYLTSIVLLLVYYGASPLQPSMQTIAPIQIATGQGTLSIQAPRINQAPTGINVINWLDDHKYKHILRDIYPDFRRKIDANTLQLVMVMTGDTSITPEGVELGLIPEDKVQTVMLCRTDSPSGLLNMATPPRLRNGMDYQVVYWAMENFCADAFAHYSAMGLGISYPLFNTVILRFRTYSSNGSVLLRDVYADMIEYAIQTGTPLDSDQRLLLADANPEFLERFEIQYRKPFWEKVCNRQASYSSLPMQLQALASNVGIEPNDDRVTVCSQLKSISTMDKEVAKDAIVSRQRARLSAKHAEVDEFTNGQVPVLSCTKLSSSDGDYMDYPDLYVASYRDSKKRVWCFPSYNYQSILERKINPVDGTELPAIFLAEVRGKDEIIKKMGVSEKSAHKVDDILDGLAKPDIYYDDRSKEQVQLFYTEIAKYRITSDDIHKLTPKALNDSAKAGGYNGNLDLLTLDHAIVTIAYIVNFYRVNNSSRADTIVNSIRENVHWSWEQAATANVQQKVVLVNPPPVAPAVTQTKSVVYVPYVPPTPQPAIIQSTQYQQYGRQVPPTQNIVVRKEEVQTIPVVPRTIQGGPPGKQTIVYTRQ